MKLLLLLAILYIAYSIWRSNRIEDQRANPDPRSPERGGPQEMVQCPVCGVHLPRSEAVRGARGVHYCSNEHRLRAGG
jgi:uncharacterized protein